MQEKWMQDGIWYKIDSLGQRSAEGLCETIASAILAKSNVSEYVTYTPALIKSPKTGEMVTGCASKNFLHTDEEFFTAAQILSRTGSSILHYDENQLAKMPAAYMGIFQRNLSTYTKIPQEELAKYFATMFRFDSIVLNRDRHLNNIGFVYNTDTKTYRPAPLFDHGQSFELSTQIWNEKNTTAERIVKSATCRPFSMSFKEQASYAEVLAGGTRTFKTAFTHDDLESVLESSAAVYTDLVVRNKIKSIMEYQMEHMPQFFLDGRYQKQLEEFSKKVIDATPDMQHEVRDERVMCWYADDPSTRMFVKYPNEITVASGPETLSFQDIILKYNAMVAPYRQVSSVLADKTQRNLDRVR